jgi:periplasmic copper chaperone A
MSPRTVLAAAGIATLSLAATLPAFAHATLEVGQAPIKSSYKATVRIGHGCEGTATLKVRVRIPDGYVAVKPMPKAGWTMETVRGPYPQPVKYFDETLTEGLREVVWTGKLLDEHYDEFVVRGYLSGSLEPGSRLYIPVVQECEKGTHRWIEIPAPGKSADDYKEPAPGVKLLPATN